jgi:hypothetical protein
VRFECQQQPAGLLMQTYICVNSRSLSPGFCGPYSFPPAVRLMLTTRHHDGHYPLPEPPRIRGYESSPCFQVRDTALRQTPEQQNTGGLMSTSEPGIQVVCSLLDRDFQHRPRKLNKTHYSVSASDLRCQAERSILICPDVILFRNSTGSGCFAALFSKIFHPIG